jgi:metallophosphoesterase (TIGR00282 family)
MKLLYIGDVMGETGIQVVEKLLPKLRKEHKVDVVIAQAENVTEGKGLSLEDYRRLLKAGVDGFTGGNHSLSRPETLVLANDPSIPVTIPANMIDASGPDFKYLGTGKNKVLLVSLLGQIVGRDADKPTENPLVKIDEILNRETANNRGATIVNFHGDYSSEKVVIGHYLDGRVTAVIGDHWHVPTADARVLPGGTAHITDVGMCGTLDSSLGVTYESILPRWRDNKQTKNVLASESPFQFNALLIEADKNGLAESAVHVQKILD